ncbi:hypothetical protein ACB098_11G024400 [Castanea mollissima]
MSVIGEAALSSLFGVLFDRLASSDLLKIFQQEQVHADLNNWKKMLLKINAVLDDAEQKQDTSKLVKIWLDELVDLAYDVDDILDEFDTEELRRELNPEPHKSKVRKIFDDWVGSNQSFARLMRSKIADIDSRLQRIVTEKNDLDLRGSTGERIGTERSREATTSLVNERRTYGRDEDKKAIIELLLSIESSDTQFSVIPIVGVGGLGKTTLAQLVYNDDDVGRYFDLKAWVCVSEVFDIVRVSKEILKCITSEHCNDGDDLNSIQVKLKEKLNGKKFLVILDDVWNEDYNSWTQLCCPFEFGALGSKIIVTTRSHEVSKIMETTSPYQLSELSKDACRRLFLQHALGSTDFVAHPELEEIGREILDGCKGSPLAAKVLGGALRTKRNPNEWKNVLNSKIWEKKEGLDQETERNQSMEVLGAEYFHDLLMRSFFQQSSNNGSLFVMHDLINDLAQWAARGLFYRMEDALGSNKQFEISTKTLMLKGCHKLTKLPEKIMDLVNLRYLDITGANLIREMPVGIEKLKNLHTLSNFIVGKDNGSKIGDLMNLEFLQGRLCISSLENVLDVEDARRANLNGKKNLDALEIEWGSAPNDLQDASIAKDILEMLRPSTTVKKLSINGYIGVKFPTWLGSHSFSYIVDLKIVGCAKCISLPAIGHLSNLKFLAIKSMSMVQTIGPEFYGEDFLKSFQNLETLCFEDMQEWQDWIPCGVEYGEFPRLRDLFISQCPKLQGKLPHHLPSLEKISISNCKQLVVSIPSLPMLHELKVVGCKEVVRKNMEELCLLESITFSLPGLKSLSKEFMEGLAKVKNLKLDYCNELTPLWQDSLKSLVRLEIKSCLSLINISLTATLKTLNINGCGALKSLPMSNCTCLEYATIKNCSSLMFISKRQLPPTLNKLKIINCENLQFLIDEGEASSLLMKEESIDSNTSLLEHLFISDCPSLKCVPLRGDLFVKLKFLEIWNCSNLTSLSSSNQLPMAIKKLDVRKCPKLESLADNLHNNVSLEYLGIRNCNEIKFLPEGLHKLRHLNDIGIVGCCSLVSFPDGGFLPTHLRNLSIYWCEKLEALPRMHMVTTLYIYECPSIVSLPEEGLPTNLKELWLGGMTNCKQVFEWGLHRLTSLTHLTIYGNGFEDWLSFPKEEDAKMMLPLPTSLTVLWIFNFPDIVFLSSKVFQNLSALERLWIWDCPKLASLPDNGLPPSLLQIQIDKCAVLKQHCKKGRGQEWLKNIINIPCVKIDNQSIYELQEEEQQ